MQTIVIVMLLAIFPSTFANNDIQFTAVDVGQSIRDKKAVQARTIGIDASLIAKTLTKTNDGLKIEKATEINLLNAAKPLVKTDVGLQQARLFSLLDNVNTLAAVQPAAQTARLQQAKTSPHSTNQTADVSLKKPALLRRMRVIKNEPFQERFSRRTYGDHRFDANGIANLTFGTLSAAQIKLDVGMSDDVFFVYGPQCNDTECKRDKVMSTYTGTDAKKLALPAKLDYIRDGIVAKGFAKGSVYKDQVVLADEIQAELPFGVAESGDIFNNIVTSDGYLGLGFAATSGYTYKTLESMFLAVEEKFITIWMDKDLFTGTIVVGSKTAEGCTNKTTEFFNTLKERSGKNNRQWMFNVDKVQMGENNESNKVVRVDINYKWIGVPKDYHDLIKKQLNNGVVEDLAKMPTLKVTIGIDVLVLKPEAYTYTINDKIYSAIVQAPLSNDYHFLFGSPLLRQFCVILANPKTDIYQIGFAMTPTNSFTTSGPATFGLLMVFFIQILRF